MDRKKDKEEELEKSDDPSESELFKDEEVAETEDKDVEEEDELDRDEAEEEVDDESEEEESEDSEESDEEEERIDEDPEPVRRPTYEPPAQQEDLEPEPASKQHSLHEQARSEFGPIKRPRTFSMNPERESSASYSIGQPLNRKSGSGKKTFFLIIILLLVLLGGGFLILKSRGALGSLIGGPTPTPAPTETPEPTPTPNPLNKEEWRFEVLNGSGETGLAKKVADKIKEQGYIVTKTGNADKSNYDKTQLFVLKDLEGKVDLVVADLKDIIKIASFGGELTTSKDSTASARIIIGKDSI